VTTREEKETLELLRRLDERMLLVIALLEALVELSRPPTYKAPVGFGFVSKK
jgi:hypothetical protein